jgi:IS30 family transposase
VVVGREPETVKRTEFVRLMREEGLSHWAAGRAVEIHRATAHKWHRQYRVRARRDLWRQHSVMAVPQKQSRFLDEDERIYIADRHLLGVPDAQIARELGRAASTIGDELKRGRDPRSGSYNPFRAQKLADGNRLRPGRGRIVNDAQLRAWVVGKLNLNWSPELIAHELRIEFPQRPDWHVCPETIYQAVYRPELGGLHREAKTKALRTGRRPRKTRNRQERRGRIPNMTPISQRPASAGNRSQEGHWEGDLIIGEFSRSAIGTLVERVSRFTILLHLGVGKHSAQVVTAAVIEAMQGLPSHLRRSLTWDQGNELTNHAEISEALSMPVFFCEPASPWQRPTNENTNGLLRDYFPKSTDLRVHDAARLTQVAAELNDRPRKWLGWQRPGHLFEDLRAKQD